MHQIILYAKPLCLVSLLTITIGCSKDVPVAGRLVWDDGSPAVELAGATIELQSIEDSASADQIVTCTGVVQRDGQFDMTVAGSDDRPPAGRYRGLVIAPKWSPSTIGTQNDLDRVAEQVLDPRFDNFDSSGIEVEIPATGALPVIEVQRAK